MTSPHLWTVHNRDTGDKDELSDRQMWDFFRGFFHWLEMGTWEQQDARTQQAFIGFITAAEDPPDEDNLDLQDRYRRVAVFECRNLISLLVQSRLPNSREISIAVLGRIRAITEGEAEVRPATIADAKTLGELAELAEALSGKGVD